MLPIPALRMAKFISWHGAFSIPDISARTYYKKATLSISWYENHTLHTFLGGLLHVGYPLPFLDLVVCLRLWLGG
jgi:hypothetical protein